MDILIAIDALDDAVYQARAVPLTDQVRLDAHELRRLVAQVRAVLPEGSERGPMTAVLDAMEAIVTAGRPIPLTSQVRVPRRPLYDRIDELRALVQPRAW